MAFNLAVTYAMARVKKNDVSRVSREREAGDCFAAHLC